MNLKIKKLYPALFRTDLHHYLPNPPKNPKPHNRNILFRHSSVCNPGYIDRDISIGRLYRAHHQFQQLDFRSVRWNDIWWFSDSPALQNEMDCAIPPWWSAFRELYQCGLLFVSNTHQTDQHDALSRKALKVWGEREARIENTDRLLLMGYWEWNSSRYRP